jgi:hypothetical protein
MDWIQTLSIITTVVASTYYIHRDIKEDMKAQSARTDRLYEIFTETLKSQTSRTDKLYEMFIDLLKEGRK